MTAALETVLARAGLKVTASQFLSLVEDAAKKLTSPPTDPAAHFSADRKSVV